MSQLKNQVSELKSKLAEAEDAYSKERQEILADTHIYKNMEAQFYSDKVKPFDKGFEWDEGGGINEWVRYPALDDIEESDRKHFEQLVSDSYGFTINWEHSTLLSWLGDDNITINDDGDVFEGDKCIIKRDEYRDDDGHLNETERNRLIEVHMESSGYFPGVFETDRYGNINLINTKAN